MDTLTVLEIGRQGLSTMVLLMAPPLVVALVVGVIISILQAATQVQEMTLSFVPKVLAVFASLIIFGPWLLNHMMVYTHQLLGGFPSLLRP